MSEDNSGELEWLVDPDTRRENVQMEWKKAHAGVGEDLILEYVKQVQVHTRATDSSFRVHTVTGNRCVYRNQAPAGLARLILRAYEARAANPLQVTMILEPVRRMNARGGFLADAIQQGYMLSDNSTVTLSLIDVMCTCDAFKKKMHAQNSKAFYWCLHILHIFKLCGKVPGDYELLQAGLTPGECSDLIEVAAQRVTERQPETGKPKEGEWVITKPTNRTAKCQGSFGIGRHKCTLPDIGARENRLVVYGKRKVEDKWVLQKFSFHVRAQCVNQQFTSMVKVGRPPSVFYLAQGCNMTGDDRLASGLTIVDQSG